MSTANISTAANTRNNSAAANFVAASHTKTRDSYTATTSHPISSPPALAPTPRRKPSSRRWIFPSSSCSREGAKCSPPICLPWLNSTLTLSET